MPSRKTSPSLPLLADAAGAFASRWRKRALLIAAAYGATATAWIYFSDRALAALGLTREVLLEVSVYKGFAFVAVTTALLTILLLRAFHTIERSYAALEAKERERAAHEVEIERLSRLYAALSQINQAIVWTKSREELFRKICEVLVEHGKFRLAWIGWHEPASRQIVPQATAGDETGYVKSFVVYADERPAGQGPAGVAFRTAQPYICNDLSSDPRVAPWRDKAERDDIHALAVFPIREAGEVAGLINVYADEAGFFKDREIALLAEAATDISFALDNLKREAERAAAEATARREKAFSDTILESLPGILYFYDERGRFLRWNRTFERVSGYSAEEVARMHPRDFFRPEDRAAVEARIAETFGRGASSVEAPFRARDDTVKPYYFTGQRVEFDGKRCLVGVGIDLSERKQAEAALERSERRYRTTLDSILEGCQLIASDWTYVYLNATAERHNRRPNAELLGRRMQEAWPGIEATNVFAMMRRCMEEGQPVHAETEFAYPNGTTGWFDVRAQPVPEGIFVLSIDITEQKRAEAALQELRSRFEIVVENLSEGLAIADAAGEVVYWNPAALRLIGFDDVEEGRSRARDFGRLFELAKLGGDVLPEEEWPLARARRGEGYEGLELRVRRKGTARERVLCYSGARIAYDGRRALSFVTIQDITERKRAEGLLREANETLELKVATRTKELQAALVRAEAADRIKSAFLATMSHELRTPLNSIIGFTGIVLQGLAGPLNAEQSKQLGMVRDSSRHLLELINDVLDLSKIEAGQLEVRSERFDLAAAVQRVIDSLQPLAARKRLVLEAVGTAELGEIASDRRRVEQILINLLNNAIKFTPRGGVTLTARNISDFRMQPGDAPAAGVELGVADTGIGIKPQDLAVLFQPFRQIDSGLARLHEGTGLGLAICRRLATLLGGRIDVRSEWGRGSVFTLTIPSTRPPPA